MTLQLNINKLAGPGRPARPIQYEKVRDLNAADLGLLATVDLQMQPPPIKRLTDRHHSLARLLAAGVTEGEAALITGYDKSRISILKNSPAFQELLALRRKEVDTEFATVLDHMAGLSRDALLELRERLEETPEKFSNAELLRVTTDLVDRTQDDGFDDMKLPTRIELVAPDPSSLPTRQAEGDNE